MKEQILKLRAEGKSYRQIKKIVGCSKATIAYHCSDKVKEKIKENTQRYRKENPINKKLSCFLKKKIHYNLGNSQEEITGNKKYDKKGKEDFIKSCKENPICFWTKLPIDLTDSSDYQLDHYIPLSKGGSNTFDNIKLCKSEANKMKSDLLPEDFIKYCIIIAENHKFSI